MTRWAIDALRFRVRGASDDATQKLLGEVKEVFRGISARQLARLTPEVLVGLLPRIYPQMLAEVHFHQDAGRPTFIVSAAGNDIVKQLAAVLGMEDGIGTAYRVDPETDAYTGELEGPFVYGKGKVEAMRRYAEEHGIDLGASYAYSDSASDLPMMQVVGNPVAVNPDRALQSVAHHRGWPIVEFNAAGKRRRRMAMSSGVGFVAAAGGYAVGRVRTERQMRQLMAETAGRRWSLRGG
jgi:HAD superfamily hydrolase (TIGR01490 family)